MADPGYGAAVAAVCAAHGVRAVLPLTDLDPVLLAQAAPLIEAAGARAFLPSAEVALACQDKWLCHELLTARALPSPETWLPEAADPATLPYPVLLKPRLGFAGRHIYRCSDPDELAFFVATPRGGRRAARPARPGVQRYRLSRRPRRAALGAVPGP